MYDALPSELSNILYKSLNVPRWRKSGDNSKANLKHILCQMKFRYLCPKHELFCFAASTFRMFALIFSFWFKWNQNCFSNYVLCMWVCRWDADCDSGDKAQDSKRLASFLLMCAIRQSPCIVHWMVMIGISLTIQICNENSTQKQHQKTSEMQRQWADKMCRVSTML